MFPKLINEKGKKLKITIKAAVADNPTINWDELKNRKFTSTSNEFYRTKSKNNESNLTSRGGEFPSSHINQKEGVYKKLTTNNFFTLKQKSLLTSKSNTMVPKDSYENNNLPNRKLTSFSLSKSKLFNIRNDKVNESETRFLHIDYSLYNKKDFKIKNKSIVKLIQDIKFYGPYFSSCNICYNKNLNYYTNMDESNAIHLLEFIKSKRIGNSGFLKKGKINI